MLINFTSLHGLVTISSICPQAIMISIQDSTYPHYVIIKSSLLHTLIITIANEIESMSNAQGKTTAMVSLIFNRTI